MNQPLFLDTFLDFSAEEKLAGAFVPLGDNADVWPQEIVSEAYRQLPYLSDFAVHVVMDRVAEERGYGFGSIEVSPQTQQSSMELEASPLKTIQIPFVIREKRMAPLDVFVDGSAYNHLTEGRLRSALFRPDTFDSIKDRPPEASLYGELQPPLEATTGVGSGGVKLGSAGLVSRMLGKSGTKKAISSGGNLRKIKQAMLMPLLPRLQGQVAQRHVDRLKMAMEDPNIRMSVANAPEGVKAAFASALGLQHVSAEKTAQVAWEAIPPTVVQVSRLANGNYKFKMANAEMYEPREEEYPPEVAEEMLSDFDLTAKIESDGTITASPDATIKQTLDAEEIRTVDQAGVWKVQDKMGNTLTGWCFPQLLSLDLQPMPLTLFSNGSEHAIQEHIAGSLLSKGTDLPKARMQGYGVLYYLDHGTPKVFVPMTVQSSYRAPDGSLHFNVTTDLQEQLDLCFVPGLKNVVKVSDGEYCLPEEFAKWWMPLKSRTELVNQPLMFTKYANARPSGKGELISDGSVFTWRGEPFSKVASEKVSFLNRRDAEFVGVAAGVDPSCIKEALATAARGQKVKFAGLRTLVDPKEKIARARVKVAQQLDGIELRNYDLIKVAAVLDDAMTADKILGLGFLNAENIATFVDALPGLEYCLSQLSEMLMASRIGLKDLPEVALERAKIAFEDVIQGLRTLKQREVGFVEG